jgi:oligoendopeptidase F
MEIRTKERNEIEEKYKWDLTIMYDGVDKWEAEFKMLEDKIAGFIKHKGKITKSANNLLAVLEQGDEIGNLFERLSSYAIRKNDEDTRNSESDKLKNKIVSLEAEFGEKVSFFLPELLKMDEEKLNAFINENEKLKVYKHYLDDIFRFKEHTLTIKEEKVLASASEILMAPSNIFSKLNDADIKFNNIKDEDGNIVELSKGNYSKYVSSQKREVRKSTFETLYSGYKNHRNTFAETFIGDIKANYFISKNRKYKSPLERALYSDNIDTKVYDSVIKSVNNNLDKMHKYVNMKKQILGLDEMHMYDMYVDLIKEYDVEYKYEDALELVFNALKPLGEDYIKNARRVFNERWVDVYENAGKRSGAYSSRGYDTPPYILLNYSGKLHDVSTLIHELGHSMHSYYSSLKQPFIYHNYPIFLAEIASNVNEMLLNMYMLEHASNTQEELSLINSFLENVKGSIYRQTMFAEFEREAYEMEGNKETITEKDLSDLYYKLNKKYYGDDVIHDDDIRCEWMRIPHFYYQFYVYKYATGLTAAFFIAKDLYEDKEDSQKKYIEFLSSGNSDYPLELLKTLGLDMTSDEAMNRILNYFGEQIDEFIKLANKK